VCVAVAGPAGGQAIVCGGPSPKFQEHVVTPDPEISAVNETSYPPAARTWSHGGTVASMLLTFGHGVGVHAMAANSL
jgi:hypothetical protein